MSLPFVKMHGAANDFVVVDRRASAFPDPPGPLVRRLCDRRRGIGADGVLLLEPDSSADFAMRYYNRDGGAADFCGNGARCIARRALDLGLGADGSVRFTTAAGTMTARRAGADRIALHFGRIARAGERLTVEAAGRTFTGRCVMAGVPHFVTPVEALEDVPVAEWGAALRHHPGFGARGANVDFVRASAPGRVAMRTYERGVEAETLACGSGAMASALWHAAEGGPAPVTVRTAGGDDLEVAFTEQDGAWDVTLTGPAEVAFEGVWLDA
jgi:diaminopimelate epimerase